MLKMDYGNLVRDYNNTFKPEILLKSKIMEN